VPGPPNSVVVGHIHSHPFAAQDMVPPHVCPQAPRGGSGVSGPSPHDSAAAVNSGIPQYVVDRDSIYLIDTSGQRKSWSRSQPGCTDIIPQKPTPNSMPFDRPLLYDRSPRFSHGSRP
jgi:hypothetical protein